MLTSLMLTMLSDDNIVYCCTAGRLQIDFKVCFKYIAM
jgi:hypothetical protein